MMTLLATIVAFAFGAVIGSFLNVVALRYPAETAGGRSRCPHCRRQLTAWELVPIVSFLLVRGRCSTCHTALSWQYPLVELLLGTLFALIVTPVPATGQGLLVAAASAGVVSWLVLLLLIDIRTMLLPDRYVLGLTMTILILLMLNPPTLLVWSRFWGAVTGAGFLGLLWLVTRGRGIGLGDVKLLLPLGALLGLPGTIVMLWLAFMAGGLVGLYLLVRGHAGLKTAVPFGPFLVAASLALFLYPELSQVLFWWVRGNGTL
jgi:leader peptidase (prepilin peptidase)/N-methyltransferase